MCADERTSGRADGRTGGRADARRPVEPEDITLARRLRIEAAEMRQALAAAVELIREQRSAGIRALFVKPKAFRGESD